MNEKIIKLCEKITAQQQERLRKSDLACETNLKNYVAHSKEGKKYIKVDVGASGKLMIEKETEKIYGIKAYGVIHRGHFYGTLDTVDQYNWSDYYPRRIAA